MLNQALEQTRPAALQRQVGIRGPDVAAWPVTSNPSGRPASPWSACRRNSTRRCKAVVRELPECDRLIVVTDEQSHDRVPDLAGYMVNVASARNGVDYGRWLHIDGWWDKVLDYIARWEAGGEPVT